MKDQTKRLLNQTKPVLNVVRRYLTFIVILIFLSIYVALVLRINQLNSATPSAATVSSQIQTLPSPHVDQSTLDKVQQLQNQNIQVQALFNQARNNPFSE